MLKMPALTILLWILAIPAHAQTDAGKAISGKWDWIGGQALKVNTDGSFEIYQGWGGLSINDGRWVKLSGQRYRLTQRLGGYVDTVSLASDGNSLDGTSNSGLSLHGSRRSDQEVTRAALPSTTSEPWFSFPPYPGAVGLCQNRNLVVEAISLPPPPGYKPVWTQHGTAMTFVTTPDAPSKVIAFYAEAVGKDARSGGQSIVINQPDGTLSVHAASDEDYPEHRDCMRKPSPGQKTVIVVGGAIMYWR